MSPVGFVLFTSVTAGPSVASLSPGLRVSVPLAAGALPTPAFFIWAHLLSAWISHPTFPSRIPGLQCPEFFCVRECLPLAFFLKDHLAKPDTFPPAGFRRGSVRRRLCEVGA